MNSHWSASGQPTSSQRPSGDQVGPVRTPGAPEEDPLSACPRSLEDELRRRRVQARQGIARHRLGSTTSDVERREARSVRRHGPSDRGARRRRGEPLAVGRGGPQRVAGVDVDGVHLLIGVDVGERMRGDPARRRDLRRRSDWPPGRGYRRDVAGDEMVACAGAVDDAEVGTASVGDPESDREIARRPARVLGAARGRRRPADVANRVDRDQLAAVSGGDEEAVRGPGRVAVVAEQPLRAVVVDDPRALRGFDQQLARGREGAQLWPRVLLPDPDHVPDQIDDPGSGGAQADDDQPDDHRRREYRPPDAAGGSGRRAVGVRRADNGPGALLGRRLARRPQVAKPAPDLAVAAHPGSSETIGRRRSSPRRSRELTVPRGRPRISPISPGV